MNATRRGFAAVFAITLIMLVGVALVALGRHFAADVKRTRAQATDAQLRQLLTAGAAMTVKDSPTTQQSVRLPQELADQGASLSIEYSRIDDDHRDATIRARLASRTVEQTIRFERQAGRWRPVAATLNSSHSPPPTSGNAVGP
jgi:type II secretory pathway component PulK